MKNCIKNCEMCNSHCDGYGCYDADFVQEVQWAEKMEQAYYKTFDLDDQEKAAEIRRNINHNLAGMGFEPVR